MEYTIITDSGLNWDIRWDYFSEHHRDTFNALTKHGHRRIIALHKQREKDAPNGAIAGTHAGCIMYHTERLNTL